MRDGKAIHKLDLRNPTRQRSAVPCGKTGNNEKNDRNRRKHVDMKENE
jgi:hypothetical protein